MEFLGRLRSMKGNDTVSISMPRSRYIRPNFAVILKHSFNSRRSACRWSSPLSTRPPGNSHKPALLRSCPRFEIKTHPSRTMIAATTSIGWTWGARVHLKLGSNFKHAASESEVGVGAKYVDCNLIAELSRGFHNFHQSLDSSSFQSSCRSIPRDCHSYQEEVKTRPFAVRSTARVNGISETSPAVIAALLHLGVAVRVAVSFTAAGWVPALGNCAE